jgi:hypothetical protein
MDTQFFTNIFTGWNFGLAGQGIFAIIVVFISLLLTRNTRKMGTVMLPISICLFTFGIPIGMPVMTIYSLLWFISTFSVKPVADLITSPYSFVTSRLSEYDKAKETFAKFLSDKRQESAFNKMKERYKLKHSTEKAQIEVSKLVDKAKMQQLSWQDERKLKKLIKQVNKPQIDLKDAIFDKTKKGLADQLKFIKNMEDYNLRKDMLERKRMADMKKQIDETFLRKVGHDKEAAKSIQDTLKAKISFGKKTAKDIKQNLQEKQGHALSMKEHFIEMFRKKQSHDIAKMTPEQEKAYWERMRRLWNSLK